MGVGSGVGSGGGSGVTSGVGVGVDSGVGVGVGVGSASIASAAEGHTAIAAMARTASQPTALAVLKRLPIPARLLPRATGRRVGPVSSFPFRLK